MTNETKCTLADRCKKAATPACNNECGAWIALYGLDGKGGRVGAAGLPADYRHVTLKNSPAMGAQAAIYERLDRYVATFERQFDEGGVRNRIKSLYLYSDSPGTGKTTTASTLLNAYIAEHYVGSLKRGRQPDQLPAYFLDVNALQTLYNEFNRSNIPQDVAEPAARRYYAMGTKAKTAPFAIYDDIGVRTATEAFRSDLHDIINYRTVNGLPTIYTSNIPIGELAQVFDARLYDRIRDQCAELAFTGESKRGRR